jgi:hypothetical protein
MTTPQPAKKTFKENTVEKLATDVTTGIISRHATKARDVAYIFLALPTGTTAPTADEIKDKGFIGFMDHPEQEIIDSYFGIDVYCLANLEDSKTDYGILTVWAA